MFTSSFKLVDHNQCNLFATFFKNEYQKEEPKKSLRTSGEATRFKKQESSADVIYYRWAKYFSHFTAFRKESKGEVQE